MTIYKHFTTSICLIIWLIGLSYWYWCLEYWAFSTSTFDGKCTCMNGYTRWENYSWDPYCVSENSLCQKEFGSNAESAWDWYCKCRRWYMMDEKYGKKECILWQTYCTNNAWIQSIYNYTDDTCNCRSWYELKDWTCQEKNYTTYWSLKELRDNSAIVFFKNPDSYMGNYNYYRIDFWLGCTSIDNYISEIVVLNLMNDNKLNYWDYLVLPNSEDINWKNQSCVISYVNKVTENQSLYTCQEIYWPYSQSLFNGKCTCQYWYEFQGDECVKVENSVWLNFAKQVESDSNETTWKEVDAWWQSELSLAIKWMYDNDLTMYSTVSNFDISWELTREQAAKFFSQFSTKILWKGLNKDGITFNDLSNADITLQPYIVVAGGQWLFQWVNWNFLPHQKLTEAQAVAVIIRTKYGFQNEEWEKRYAEYYNLANNNWLLNWLFFDLERMDDKYITRWAVALLLYRLKGL